VKKQLSLICLLLTVAVICYGQKKEYVCQPCGGTCDEKVLDKPGTCPTCQMALVEKSTVRTKHASPREFCERMTANPDAIVLDVRSPGEFDGSSTGVESYGHFQRAININIDQLESRIKELSAYKNREILVYCSHSRRSPRAAYYLTTQGFENVINMSGGVSTVGDAMKLDCFMSQFVPHKKK
jgi:rhodanese-related sulfurtransferase